MNYEYAVEDINYEDYASGRVLYNQKGTTSYPARLINEIFGRCMKYLENQGIHYPYSIYDPLCGGAYALTILGFLHMERIQRLVASDVDTEIVDFASKNLSLLSEEGMDMRIAQLHEYVSEYGKESHKEALESAMRLKEQIIRTTHRIQTYCFPADALEPKPEEAHEKFDMIITDVPYGELVDWTTKDGEDAITLLLQNLLPCLASHSIVVVSSRKKTTVKHINYTRVDKFNVGKRQIVFLRPNTK